MIINFGLPRARRYPYLCFPKALFEALLIPMFKAFVKAFSEAVFRRFCKVGDDRDFATKIHSCGSSREMEIGTIVIQERALRKSRQGYIFGTFVFASYLSRSSLFGIPILALLIKKGTLRH